MSRRPAIVANWKMFKTREEARSTSARVLELVGDCRDVDIVLCPPFTALSTVSDVVSGSVVHVGGQNAYWEDEGAFTGEISFPMLIDCGCRYVILGHSERRQLFKETDEMVNMKVKKALRTDLTPIVCCGETLQQREAGRARDVVLTQLERAFEGLTAESLSRMIIAYEPIWAIGTGWTATPELAQEVHYMIRNWLRERFSAELPGQTRILYGGSVKPSNVANLMAQDDIDGALVGGASLEAESFAKLVKFSD